MDRWNQRVVKRECCAYKYERRFCTNTKELRAQKYERTVCRNVKNGTPTNMTPDWGQDEWSQMKSNYMELKMFKLNPKNKFGNGFSTEEQAR